ncbi:MAG: helix-turn-helix transcriptional regulator, partial [Exiguobacterium sp.]|nr:helix-turn-helix transcriptional regulator [Exiguobacterium sp.]
MNQKEINQLVGKNIKLYIEAVGKSPKWVYERAGMTKSTYYDLLKGNGDINKNVQKINKLFRINEPFYFYNEQFVPPKTIEQIELE